MNWKQVTKGECTRYLKQFTIADRFSSHTEYGVRLRSGDSGTIETISLNNSPVLRISISNNRHFGMVEVPIK